MSKRRIQGLVAGAAAALVVMIVNVVPAAALSASATISAGSLAFVSTPGSVSFSDTLNGLDQTATTTEAIDAGDATGSGAGWNLTATSTTFTSSGHTLSTTATTIPSGSAPTVACDASATCATASNSITYPYTLPAAATAPTATKVYDAALNSGMGNQTVSLDWHLAIPADAFAGSYASTWTVSLVSGP